MQEESALFFKQMDLSRTQVISLFEWQKEKRKGIQVKSTAEIEIKVKHWAYCHEDLWEYKFRMLAFGVVWGK